MLQLFKRRNMISPGSRFCRGQMAISVRSVSTGKLRKLEDDNGNNDKPVRKESGKLLSVSDSHNNTNRYTSSAVSSVDASDEMANKDSYKNMSHGAQMTSEKANKWSQTKTRSLIVPRVASTEHIPRESLHLEGLFAGYRPLFLGDSSIPTEGNNISSGALSFKNQMDLTSTTNLHNNSRKLIVPWNASISGVKYKDEAFHKLPNNLVSKLRPFEHQPEISVFNTQINKKRDQMVRMRVHNSKINDTSELVDLFNLKDESHYPAIKNTMYGAAAKQDTGFREKLKKYRNDYKNQLQSLVYDYKFIRDDQIKLRDTIQSLNEQLIDKFEELTGLKLQLESIQQTLPLFIYFQSDIITKRRLKRVIMSSIKLHTDPILSSLLPNFDNKEQSKSFQTIFQSQINKIVSILVRRIPSLLFADSSKSVDCVIQRSPVPGFKRLYRLQTSNKRITARNNVARGRTGFRTTKHTNEIYAKTLNEVFKEWDYYTC